MSDLPWYRRFPDNFISGTIGLSLEEKGAYGLIIDLIYVRGGPVPDEPRYIAGVCNCSVRKWNAIRQRLIDLGKIELVNGCLMNRRAEEELEISARSARERAENGAKGGDKSAENRAAVSKNNAVAQAALKHAGASPLPSQFKKEGNSVSEGRPAAPEEGAVWLDRFVDEELFKACEALTKSVPKFMQRQVWPKSVVDRARAELTKSKAAA